MEYKDGKWARKILELQHKDGSWGFFHTLSNPVPGRPMTTEQALRRLEILGFTMEDKPIQKTVKYLHDCLTGAEEIPDHKEKGSDWKTYVDLMLSTWIKRFTADDKYANAVSDKWAELVNSSFFGNKYNQQEFEFAYHKIFNPENGKRIWGCMSFYVVSILANKMSENIEPLYFDYVLNFPAGVYYYGYNKSVKILPEIFQSRKTCTYLRMVDLLASYESKKCRGKLAFVKKWLNANNIGKNEWDLGKNSKDNILLPLSDSWRDEVDRIKDCSRVVGGILGRL